VNKLVKSSIIFEFRKLNFFNSTTQADSGIGTSHSITCDITNILDCATTVYHKTTRAVHYLHIYFKLNFDKTNFWLNQGLN
jgi:hypothetical protein